MRPAGKQRHSSHPHLGEGARAHLASPALTDRWTDGRTAPGRGAAAHGADPRRTRSTGAQRPPFRDRRRLGRSPSLARNEAALGGRGGAERWGQGAVLTSRLQHRHGGLCLSQEHRPSGRLPSAAGRHRGCAQCFAAAGSGVFLASVSTYAFCAFISNVAV